MEDFTYRAGIALDATPVLKAVEKIQGALEHIRLSPSLDSKFYKNFDAIEQAIAEFNQKMARGATKDALKSGKNIVDLYDKLQIKVKELGQRSEADMKKMFPTEVTQKIIAANVALRQYKESTTNSSKEVEKLNKKINEQEALHAKATQSQEEANKKTVIGQEEYDSISRSIAHYRGELTKLIKARDAAKTEAETQGLSPLVTQSAERLGFGPVSGFNAQITAIQAKIDRMVQDLSTKIGAKDKDTILANMTRQADAALKQIGKLTDDLGQLESEDIEKLTELFETLGNLGFNTEGIEKTAESAHQLVEDFSEEQTSEIAQGLHEMQAAEVEGEKATEEFDKSLFEGQNALEEFDKQSKDLDSFKARIGAFFTASNAIQLFKQAVRNAFESVKELDAIMTDIAVVTQFDVSDMWEQLPEYTERAKELGITIADAYKSAALWYQQGNR